jgi:hypothetical protein
MTLMTMHHIPTPLRFAAVALSMVMGICSSHAQPFQPADWQQAVAGNTAVAIALDAVDNAYVLGVVPSSTFDSKVGTLSLNRYSPTGALLWARSWTYGAAGEAGGRAQSLFTDAAGNAYVIGAADYFNYSVSTEGAPSQIVGVADGYWLVLKYSPDGTLLWERRQFSSSTVAVRGVADAAGDVYVALESKGPHTASVVKLSGVDGTTLWTRNTPDSVKFGGLGLTPTGHPVLSTASTALGLSVVEYDAATGTEVSRVAHSAAAGSYVSSLVVGSNGDVVVGQPSFKRRLPKLPKCAKWPWTAAATSWQRASAREPA